MFETLMRSGAYRVDYLNRAAIGAPAAFGFYVRGELPAQTRYSITAKHHLFAGLDVIKRLLGMGNLVAIYVDIDDGSNLKRPAYLQLKQDLRKGLFRRVFVYDANDLLGAPAAFEDLWMLHEELSDFGLLAYDALLQRVQVRRLRRPAWMKTKEKVCA